MAMPNRVPRAALCCAIVALLLAAAARAEDVYYRVPVKDLKFTDGQLPAEESSRAVRPSDVDRLTARAVLDGEGEVYVTPPTAPQWAKYTSPADQSSLLIRMPRAGEITGTLYWPQPEESIPFAKLKFVVEAEPSDKAKREFWAEKQAYYEDLVNRGVAGAAWFRHQAREAKKMRPDAAANGVLDEGQALQNAMRSDPLRNSLGLVSGGRAIAENLQLDRLPAPAADAADAVAVDSLPGISVAEIDWKPLLKDPPPATDPLAKLVPADQHVLLFPSFAAFALVADRLKDEGAIVARLTAAPIGDGRLAARYERQLGLALDGPGRIVGPQLIGSVAVTGSDPYFETGTDVALLFESAQPEELKKVLLAQVTANASTLATAEKIAGQVAGLDYVGMRSPDRQVSSYVAALPGAVVVTNSPVQLERLAAVTQGKTPAITSLDEYAFFRGRYPRGEGDESALLVISDGAIRRWCGARWRIGASRQTRNAAVLAELQATYLDKLVKKEPVAGELKTELPLAGGGTLSVSNGDVCSAEYGDLRFLTPIAELKFDQVSEAEAKAYRDWLDGYQKYWRWSFDPIAVRLSVRAERLAADLTVMPLIGSTEYKRWLDYTLGATIAPEAGDRHHSIFEIIGAINKQAPELRRMRTEYARMDPEWKGDPLGWLGESLALYVDYDSFWNDLAAQKPDEDRTKFLFLNLSSIPVALWFEVGDGPALRAFLEHVEADFARQWGGVTSWKKLDYHGQPYTKIILTAPFFDNDPKKNEIHLFVVPNDKFLLITPNEPLLMRALNRQLGPAGKEGKPNGAAAKKDTKESKQAAVDTDAGEVGTGTAGTARRGLQPWLGTNVGLQVDQKLLALLWESFGNEYQRWQQAQSWRNLPILNEWHRLYPQEDPVALHERVWHQRLVCPGGGQYVWNEAWQTMESTVLGHPAEPKAGPTAPAELLRFRFANFGLTFENAGLRARMTLDRKASAAAPAAAQQ